MNEIEFYFPNKERKLTKMDIVKTEHDLISCVLEITNDRISAELPTSTNEVVARIDGIRTMAEALMDLLEDENMQDNVQDNT